MGHELSCTDQFTTQTSQGLFGLEVIVLSSTDYMSHSKVHLILGKQGVTVNEYRFSFGVMKISKIDYGDGWLHNSVNILKIIDLNTLNGELYYK